MNKIMCKWCGNYFMSDSNRYCGACLSSPANPERHKEHAHHGDQFITVDCDLFCARAGIQEWEPKPEDLKETVIAMAARLDKIILAKVSAYLMEQEKKKTESWRDRPPLL